MKIDSVKISNILSFPYCKDMESVQNIFFEGGLNILIGPNGSGKSSFLEVLNQIFQKFLFIPCKYNKTYLNNEVNKKSTLTKEDAGEMAQLSKHWDYPDKEMRVQICISFNEHDKKNIEFVNIHKEKINSIFADYCGEDIQVPNSTNQKSAISLMIEFTSSDGKRFERKICATNENEINSDQELFLQFYLERFEFIQNTIFLHNDLADAKGHLEKWDPLLRTFGIIGCYRNYNSFDPRHSIDNKGELVHLQDKIKDIKNNESTRMGDNVQQRSLELAKARLSYLYHRYRDENGSEDLDSIILKDPIVLNINEYLKDFLNLELKIGRPNLDQLQQELLFSEVIDRKNRLVSDMSSGEKGLLYFVLSFAAYDLRSGLMIIDEPELHLHPQAQKKLLIYFEKIAKKYDVQFIIATHSPIFVTTDTIANVRRFDIKNGATQIFKQNTTEEDKHLVRILTYTNSSKIFFSRRVVLVEGECDEYFYRFFFDDYVCRKKKELSEKNESSEQERTFDIEFLSIMGKGERTQWSTFLDGFGVDVYFIGDWDNVTDLGIIFKAKFETVKLNYYERVSEAIDKSLKDKKSEDGKNLLKGIDSFLKNPSDQNRAALAGIRDYLFQRYTPWSSVVAYWEEADPASFKTIIEDIEKKYADNIFILKEGVLEDYLKIDGRCDLSAVIAFCKNEFSAWNLDLKNKERIAEINGIFDQITNANRIKTTHF